VYDKFNLCLEQEERKVSTLKSKEEEEEQNLNLPRRERTENSGRLIQETAREVLAKYFDFCVKEK
jgi:hypothetical protein